MVNILKRAYLDWKLQWEQQAQTSPWSSSHSFFCGQSLAKSVLKKRWFLCVLMLRYVSVGIQRICCELYVYIVRLLYVTWFNLCNNSCGNMLIEITTITESLFFFSKECPLLDKRQVFPTCIRITSCWKILCCYCGFCESVHFQEQILWWFLGTAYCYSYYAHWTMNFIPVVKSLADLGSASLAQTFFIFIQFLGNNGLAPPWVGAPLSGKSRIRQWFYQMVLLFWHIDLVQRASKEKYSRTTWTSLLHQIWPVGFTPRLKWNFSSISRGKVSAEVTLYVHFLVPIAPPPPLKLFVMETNKLAGRKIWLNHQFSLFSKDVWGLGWGVVEVWVFIFTLDLWTSKLSPTPPTELEIFLKDLEFKDSKEYMYKYS